VDDLTEEDLNPTEGPINAVPGYPLILPTAPGEYIIFPHGIQKFADEHRGEAVAVSGDGEVEVLRAGITGDDMAWVSVVVALEEPLKKEKKRND
jgi:hypothetical protein